MCSRGCSLLQPREVFLHRGSPEGGDQSEGIPGNGIIRWNTKCWLYQIFSMAFTVVSYSLVLNSMMKEFIALYYTYLSFIWIYCMFYNTMRNSQIACVLRGYFVHETAVSYTVESMLCIYVVYRDSTFNIELLLYTNDLRCDIFNMYPTMTEGWSRCQLLRSREASGLLLRQLRVQSTSLSFWFIPAAQYLCSSNVFF